MTDVDNVRPNLLLITTDQQRWDALSLHGTAGYQTPNLDRLARMGVAFGNGYCPTPVCTPCRISMLTGTYPTRHGGFQIGMAPVPALSEANLPSRLSAAGYATACIGKTHFVARSLEESHIAGLPDGQEPPEEFWDSFDGPYWGFDFVRHNRGHTCLNAPDGHYRSWLKDQGADLEAIDRLHKPLLGESKSMPIGRWELPEEWHHTAFVTEEGLAWIRQQPGPWFTMLNYQDPHAPFVCPEPYFSDVDMSGVELKQRVPGEMADKPPFYSSLLEGSRYLDEAGEDLKDELRIASLFPYDFGERSADAVRAYIGMVNMLDVYMGRILDDLEERGQLDNTLICFVSDHGEMLGNHGLWEKGICAYDDAQRIPAILAWPEAQVPERGLMPHHFNIVDIAPTFLAAAGVEIPVGSQGFNHLPYLQGDQSAVRDWSLVDFYTSSRLHQQTLVTDDWKLVVYRNQDWGELYDRRADPDQLINLYEKSEYRDMRERLLHRLVQVNMEVAGHPGERREYA